MLRCRKHVLAKLDHTAHKAQQKSKRREAFLRARDRSRAVPGVQEFETLVRDWFDPQTGVSTKRPGKDRDWFNNAKGFPTAPRLRAHVEGKESLAVTWGPCARVRVIDADAHGQDSPLDALPTLWDAIRALHIGRGGWLGPLVNGAIPDDAQLDGVIITTPNGLHYLEVTEEPWRGDTLRDDVARVTACLREQCVEVRPGRIEVLPSPNGQSRLPLGHGCTFVHPSLGDVDVVTGVDLLWRLRPVPRAFDALGWESSTTKRICQPDAENDNLDFETSTLGPDVTQHCKRVSSWRKLRSIQTRETLYEGRGSSERGQGWSGKSAFVESMERVFREGASAGMRNRQLWDLCILHRLTWGGSREDVEDRISAWFEDAPHTSKDLANLNPSRRRSARRLLHRHLDRIDRGLESGRFYQLGASKADGPSRDPLLLVPGTPKEAAEIVALGNDYLRGTTLLDGLPEWLQRVLPKLVGAVVKWSRNGRVVLPSTMLEVYAGSKASRRCPFTWEMRSPHKILLDALQRAGVIGGIVAVADRGKRLAAAFESNVGQRDAKPETAPAVVAATWPKGNGRKQAPWKRAPFTMVCRQVTPHRVVPGQRLSKRTALLDVRGRAIWRVVRAAEQLPMHPHESMRDRGTIAAREGPFDPACRVPRFPRQTQADRGPPSTPRRRQGLSCADRPPR